MYRWFGCHCFSWSSVYRMASIWYEHTRTHLWQLKAIIFIQWIFVHYRWPNGERKPYLTHPNTIIFGNMGWTTLSHYRLRSNALIHRTRNTIMHHTLSRSIKSRYYCELYQYGYYSNIIILIIISLYPRRQCRPALDYEIAFMDTHSCILFSLIELLHSFIFWCFLFWWYVIEIY